MLRYGSNGAIKRIDGGKPKSRGLPPVTFLWGRTGGKVHCRFPMAVGGSAASQCLRRGVDAYLPHGQGADMLRCTSNGAIKRIDGGKPRSRGLPPAAFFGCGQDGRCIAGSPWQLAAAPPASAFGAAVTPAGASAGRQSRQPVPLAGMTHICPTGKGQIYCDIILMVQSSALTAAFWGTRTGQKVHCRFPMAVGLALPASAFGAAVPPASAFGGRVTHICPTGRGRYTAVQV